MTVCGFAGALEDPPILSNSNDCTFEFDWYTAAACPEDRVVGGDCRVFVDNLGRKFNKFLWII